MRYTLHKTQDRIAGYILVVVKIMIGSKNFLQYYVFTMAITVDSQE